MDFIIPTGTAWHEDFEHWLAPFLAVLQRSEQRY